MITASVLLDDLAEDAYQPTQNVTPKCITKHPSSSLEDSPPLSYGFVDHDETQIANEEPIVVDSSPEKSIEVIDSNTGEPISQTSSSGVTSGVTSFAHVEPTTPSKQAWQTSARRKKSELLSPKKRKPKKTTPIKKHATKQQLKLEKFFSKKDKSPIKKDKAPTLKRERSSQEDTVSEPARKRLKEPQPF
jgi:hypothetical protein